MKEGIQTIKNPNQERGCIVCRDASRGKGVEETLVLSTRMDCGDEMWRQISGSGSGTFSGCAS